jgi:acetyl-CoA acyltransferase
VEAVRTPDRARAQGEGLLQGHPPEHAAGEDLYRGHRALGHRRSEVEDRDRGLGSAVRRAGLSTSPATPGYRPGLPIETPGTTVDRQCDSAQQAVNFSAALITAGVHDAMMHNIVS